MPDLEKDAISGEQFESSVRHVARQLYKGATASGSINLDGRERDEIIDTGTELIIIEATKHRKKEKTIYDLEKSKRLVQVLKANPKYLDHNFRIILVTLDEPTADQNEAVKVAKTGCPKEILSFKTLFSRLFDGRHYIRVRGDHYFGSIRNPADDNDYNVPPSSYIPTALSDTKSGRRLEAVQLAQSASQGGRFVLFGDYGSGKSMTLRHIYLRCRDRFIAGDTIRCPVYINLREHIAQANPDEALFRHAQIIGFGDPNPLISAWRAGFVTLFLDGFDELTPPQFGVSISNLKQARRLAVELVKKFFEQTPADAAIFLGGRENYFDDRPEAKVAIGYSDSAIVLELAGFNDDQIARYLKTKKRSLPDWLPTRPLLLGYLANSGLLSEEEGLIHLGPTAGWGQLLERICQREVKQIWGAGSEAAELRLFVERLATKSRQSVDGRRIIFDKDIRGAFQSVFGRDSDEPANLLAGRLPGLGAVPGRAGAREFIDADFADAAASGDFCRFVEAPFVGQADLRGIKASLGNLALSFALDNIEGITPKLSVALSQSARDSEMSVTSADIMSLMAEKGAPYRGDPIIISDANFDSVTIDAEADFSSITFANCVFSKIEMGRSAANTERSHYPRFFGCVIGVVEGVVSSDDLPSGVFDQATSVERFAGFAGTNDAVLESSLPQSIKVLLTILRKLFLQKGSGRQYGALKRGLPVAAARYVDPIVSLIKAEKFAQEVSLDRRKIIVPNRSRSADALAIINGPNVSDHALIRAVKEL